MTCSERAVGVRNVIPEESFLQTNTVLGYKKGCFLHDSFRVRAVILEEAF
jgi:hypothetical protein